MLGADKETLAELAALGIKNPKKALSEEFFSVTY